MCLITFNFNPFANRTLVIAANRDEFYKRPTQPVHFWKEDSAIFAGKDLEAGGTWMGISLYGRFAAITNFRDGKYLKKYETSRGNIVKRFLQVSDNINDFITFLEKEKDNYAGYNLLFMENNNMFWFSNKSDTVQLLEPGTYGLSNHLLDTEWPKVVKAKTALKEFVKSGDKNVLFGMLKDTTIAQDDQLPDTGVPFELEKMLSAPFIISPEYGTRSSTVAEIFLDGSVKYEEHLYDHIAGQFIINNYNFDMRSNTI